MASKVEPIPIWRGSRPKRRLAHYAVGADDVRAPRSKTPNDGQQTRRVNPLRPDLRLLRWRSRCWRTDTSTSHRFAAHWRTGAALFNFISAWTPGSMTWWAVDLLATDLSGFKVQAAQTQTASKRAGHSW